MTTVYRVWSKLASGRMEYGSWSEDRVRKEKYAEESRDCDGVIDAGVEVSAYDPDKEICLPGEPEYKLSEWLEFPDKKITEILKRTGSGPSEIATAFLGINELRQMQVRQSNQPQGNTP